ncbi:uncharacterized protein LOC131672851 [Phymastichus coffea]|uniref:uncharacterized protein LOC131672851 n=1 Tax=Phymastichus coffea TaxID=108790 RepID=UPI00273AD1AB|nr:uncharacterized protein LOC131672851 [Phymastichus coffea]
MNFNFQNNIFLPFYRSEVKATFIDNNTLTQETQLLEGFSLENNPEKQPDSTTIKSNQDSNLFNTGYLVLQDNSLLECNILNEDIFSADSHNPSPLLPSDNSFDSNAFLAAKSQLNTEPVMLKVIDAATQTSIDDSDPILKSKVDVGVQVMPYEIKIFSIGDRLKTDEHLNAFTGIGSFKLLDSLITCMSRLKQEQGKNRYTLPHRDRVLLTMIRVKLNISYTCLSVFFSICPNTCKNVFLETICDLSIILLPVIRWPPKEEILKNMPQCFQKYTSTVGVLDCTEMKVEKVHCLTCKIRTFSFYKGGNTSKVIICITPSGLISYVSSCNGGRSSDKQIFNESDIVQVDKGFLIEAECALAGVKLIRLPFCKNKKLTRDESHETATIVAARVHVERTIQRIKQFKLLKGIIPHYLVKSLDYILITVCGLVNLSPPILGEDTFL